MAEGETRGRISPVAVLAALLPILALLINEHFLAFAFSPDGIFSSTTKWQLRGFMAGLVGAGIVLFICRARLDEVTLRVLRLHPNASTLVIGLATALACVVFIEALYYSLDTIRARRKGWVAQAPELQPGTTTKASLSVRGETVYDVTYTIDDRYARRTVEPASKKAAYDLFFFGGSFVFGEGVEDNETLPSVVARLAPGRRVTNFGFPGHGPSNMLQRLAGDAPLRDNLRDDVTLIYVFIPGHVRRVIGSMRVATAWGRNFPSYVVDQDGKLELSGTFSDSRPALSRAYAVLSRERILAYHGVDLPLRINGEDLRITARVISEARNTFIARYDSNTFHVVLYASNARDEFSAKELIPYLDAQDVSHFDYTDLFEDGEAYWLPHDGHPTALAHEKIGVRLARDLGLGTF